MYNAGPCGSDDAPEKLKRCKKVLAAWAMGAGPFHYPEVRTKLRILSNHLISLTPIYRVTSVR